MSVEIRGRRNGCVSVHELEVLHQLVRSTGCRQLRRLATFLSLSPVNSDHLLVHSLNRLLPAVLSFTRSHCGIVVRSQIEEESFDESAVVRMARVHHVLLV